MVISRLQSLIPVVRDPILATTEETDNSKNWRCNRPKAREAPISSQIQLNYNLNEILENNKFEFSIGIGFGLLIMESKNLLWVRWHVKAPFNIEKLSKKIRQSEWARESAIWILVAKSYYNFNDKRNMNWNSIPE